MNKYKKIIGGLFFLVGMVLYGDTLHLREGWNAIGINAEMTLEEIKAQLGDNLLQIQSPDGDETYNKKLEEILKENYKPTFAKFNLGIGYWIKVNNDAELIYQSKILSGTHFIDLKGGWNLIAPLKDLSLEEIKAQLGDNLLQIQSPDGDETYNKKLEEILKENYKPTFAKFNLGIGYWIKVNNDAELKFVFSNILPYIAKNGTLRDSNMTYDQYVITVLTDANAPTTTGPNIVLYFKINNENKQLGVNANYPIGTKFQIAVYSGDSVIAISEVKELTEDAKEDNYIIFENNIEIGSTSSSSTSSSSSSTSSTPTSSSSSSSVSSSLSSSSSSSSSSAGALLTPPSPPGAGDLSTPPSPGF